MTKTGGPLRATKKPTPRVRPATPGRRLALADRRRQLLDLGVQEFSRRAYDAVSIDDVARLAGISKGLLYHYFPTKRRFYIAVVRQGARELLAATNPDPNLPPVDRLRRGLDAYLDYVDAHRVVYAALLGSGGGHDRVIARIVDQTRTALIERLLSGWPMGLSGVTPLVQLALRGWVGFVEATSVEWVEGRATERAELTALLLSVLGSVIQLAVR